MTYELFQIDRGQSQLRCAIAAHGRSRARDVGNDAVARVMATCDVVVDPRDQSVARWMLEVGHWEWEVSKAIADCMRPGTICVDLGANAGWFSALFAQLGAAQVVAVEANPELARRLRATAALNGWDHFEVVNCAVGDRAGGVRLLIWGEDNLGGSCVVSAGDQRSGVDVPMRTLDAILGDLAPIQCMKIDCEGSEPAIWRGMRNVLANNPDMHIFAEVSVNQQTEPWLRQVEADGFPLRFITDAGSFAPLEYARLHEKQLWMGYFHRD
jgi:FkbM family methyltransferase